MMMMMMYMSSLLLFLSWNIFILLISLSSFSTHIHYHNSNSNNYYARLGMAGAYPTRFNNNDNDSNNDDNNINDNDDGRSLESLFGKELYSWRFSNNNNNYNSNNKKKKYKSDDDVDEENTLAKQSTTALLKGVSYIGVYYSASWCGPCRQFTPQLIQFYYQVNQQYSSTSSSSSSSLSNKAFEIIFVSCDKSAQSFLQYFQEMPWLSVTWENVPEIRELASPLYQVNGIPHLVILDAYDLSVITIDGRDEVLRDPYGLEFPWRPRTLMNLLPRGVKQSILSMIKGLQYRFMVVVREITAHLFIPRLWSLVSMMTLGLFRTVKKVLTFVVIGD